MTKKIDTIKYERYTNLNNSEELLNELEQSEFIENVSFQKASQAINFLKEHSEDNEFKLEAATTAIIKAIAYLEEFEKDLREMMIEGIAADERQKKLSKEAHTVAQEIIGTKIIPSLDKLISDIESLNLVKNYSKTWFSYELEGFVNQIKKAARI